MGGGSKGKARAIGERKGGSEPSRAGRGAAAHKREAPQRHDRNILSCTKSGAHRTGDRIFCRACRRICERIISHSRHGTGCSGWVAGSRKARGRVKRWGMRRKTQAANRKGVDIGCGHAWQAARTANGMLLGRMRTLTACQARTIPKAWICCGWLLGSYRSRWEDGERAAERPERKRRKSQASKNHTSSKSNIVTRSTTQ